MKVLSSVVVLGIGFWMVSGRPALAQYNMGDALKKGAGDIVNQEAQQAGLISTPTAAAAASTPSAAATGAASTPSAASGSNAGGANTPAADGTPGDSGGE